MDSKISPPTEALFPAPIMGFGGLFLVVGLVIATKYLIVGIVFSCLASLILIARIGYEIDTKEMKARQYSAFLGLKRGKWVDISTQPNLAVISSRMLSNAYSRSNRSVSDHSMQFQVVLLDKDHLRKLVIYESDSKYRADKLAEQVLEHTDIKKVRYSPKRIKRKRRR